MASRFHFSNYSEKAIDLESKYLNKEMLVNHVNKPVCSWSNLLLKQEWVSLDGMVFFRLLAERGSLQDLIHLQGCSTHKLIQPHLKLQDVQSQRLHWPQCQCRHVSPHSAEQLVYRKQLWLTVAALCFTHSCKTWTVPTQKLLFFSR